MAAASFWTQSPADAATALGCGVSGLSSADAAARLVTHGRNADGPKLAPVRA